MLIVKQKYYFLVVLLLFCGNLYAAEKEETSAYSIVFYNVENLFHPSHDSLHNDIAFTPTGERHWNYTKYYNKIAHIAKVIVNIQGWEHVDIIGLAEIEDSMCLDDLCHNLPNKLYNYIHYNSQDERGIDVALLYNQQSFEPIISRPISIYLGEDKTRDILYVKGIQNKQDTLHLLVCHLPSQLGGESKTKWKRDKVYAILTQLTDSILSTNSEAKIVVMGDMNSQPSPAYLPQLINPMLEMAKNGLGTHKYHGKWNCLDQFFLSPQIALKANCQIYSAEYLLEEDKKWLGTQPKRTYIGYRYYSDGYSDHLPILLYINK